MKTLLSNIASFTLSAPEALLFRIAMHRVSAEQTGVLRQILNNNEGTAYGKQYGFSNIKTVDEFCRRVPLVEYGDISSYAERIALGEKDVLFPGSPLCMQPTSGTTAKSKMIPFTAGLRKQYQQCVAPWNFDMNATDPLLLKGTAYWSLSPVLTETRKTAGGVPLGFLDDTGYLSPFLSYFFRRSFAVPSEVGLVKDAELFRYITMAFLIKAKDLAFVSVWNPTFFLLLLDSISNNIGSIVKDIERGTLSLPDALPEELRSQLATAFGGPDARRAAEVRSLLSLGKGFGTEFYSRLWPCLRLISCWNYAEARGPAERLGALFPTVSIQPKGLMATEGVVSFPLRHAPYPVLSLRSHFYEFIPADDNSKVCRAWELDNDRIYEVVLTTAGGLYRYKTGDLVMVRGFYKQCPMLEFMGRGNHTSDFYGEKLHQQHVSEIINRVFKDRPSGSYVALLAPDGEGRVDHYTLYFASDYRTGDACLTEIGEEFERSLRSNFHYDYCRKLGQLKKLEVCLVNLDVNSVLRKQMEELNRRGMREGDIKPSVIDNRPVWRSVLGV